MTGSTPDRVPPHKFQQIRQGRDSQETGLSEPRGVWRHGAIVDGIGGPSVCWMPIELIFMELRYSRTDAARHRSPVSGALSAYEWPLCEAAGCDTKETLASLLPQPCNDRIVPGVHEARDM